MTYPTLLTVWNSRTSELGLYVLTAARPGQRPQKQASLFSGWKRTGEKGHNAHFNLYLLLLKEKFMVSDE